MKQHLVTAYTWGPSSSSGSGKGVCINISKHADSYWLLLQIEWQDVESGAQGNPIDS